jgi:hypothetical protein
MPEWTSHRSAGTGRPERGGITATHRYSVLIFSRSTFSSNWKMLSLEVKLEPPLEVKFEPNFKGRGVAVKNEPDLEGRGDIVLSENHPISRNPLANGLESGVEERFCRVKGYTVRFASLGGG